MGIDYCNRDACYQESNENKFRRCSCGEAYCDYCIVDLEKAYGMNEDDMINKCYDCDQEFPQKQYEKKVNELTEILKKHIDIPDPDPERLDILFKELVCHFIGDRYNPHIYDMLLKQIIIDD